MVRRFAALALALVLAASAFSQTFQGAEAALRAAQARRASPDVPGMGLLKRIQAFGSGHGLASEVATARWLALFDEYDKGGNDNRMPTPFAALVAALPAPESWNAIAAGLRSREAAKRDPHAESVRLFAALLRGDAAEERRVLAALTLATKGTPNAQFFVQQAREVSQALGTQSGDPASVVAAFLAELAAKPPSEEVDGMDAATSARVAAQMASARAMSEAMPVQVPDLVNLVGPAKAEAILTRALTTYPKRLIVRSKATRALAQRLALANAKALKAPQWSLVDEHNPRLYEAMAARFGTGIGKERFGSEDAATARNQYTFGLLAEGRRTEALKIARTLTGTTYFGREPGEVPGGSPALTAFLGEAVDGRPDSPLWDLYIASAARAHESDKAVATLQRTLAKGGGSNRTLLLGRLATALLAADRIDEGLATLEKAAAVTGPQEGMGEIYALQIVRIGALTDRPATVEKGLALAREIENRERNGQRGFDFGENTLVDVLLEIGRPAEAEREAIDAYAASAGNPNVGYSPGGTNPALVKLAQLYYKLDRPADVRTLLDGAAEWGVADAIDLARPNVYGYSGDGDAPLGFVAAWALAKTGDKAGAEALLTRVLPANPGFDPAYALLRELKGADAVPTLDALFAADPFEERPLIWKAVALKDAGKLPEAEATVRQAIAVDPSDGETHFGHRLYVYTVLAEIQEAKGDTVGAAQSRDAVAAIRLAEKADKYAEVGLLGRAIAGYEESTRRFSDAYCIQSRLAVDLMEQGRVKEAEEHYRRAYELMPTSFGRVETHCMGCEHVFEGEVAQNLAERVFTNLAKTTPNRPQVHYLLGYLREEQGRFPEALASYRKATVLDPDYLNAWKRQATIAQETPVPAAERKAIDDSILRLDPLGRHGAEEVTSGDLRALYRRVDRAIALRGGEGPTTAHPLAASAAALARQPSNQAEIMEMAEMQGFGLRDVRTPGMAVARTRAVMTVGQLVDNTRQGEGGTFTTSE